MRLLLKISKNTSPVPFDYQKYLVGAFHKWLGENDLHDEISLYSLSWLQGGEKVGRELDFKNGATWSISSHDSNLLKKLISSIQTNPVIAFGLTVSEILLVPNPNFEGKHKFYLNSPVFIKSKIEGRDQFYFYSNSESDEYMTKTLKTKLKKAGLPIEGVKVSFDRTYHSPKTKKITYGNIDCKGSICPVVIEGTPEQIAFAWNVGVGNSTGIGFGSLK